MNPAEKFCQQQKYPCRQAADGYFPHCRLHCPAADFPQNQQQYRRRTEKYQPDRTAQRY